MQVGFVIDQRKCIGCHACTVACKAENDVPLGSFRTWVKYVEKGTFPSVRRHFTVLRCNHCDRAPCVEICPVNALDKRPDAIVDLDRDLCIGCRACMQACPYDALYFHAERGVAEKCHYCAHRVEQGLEPACVIVCPTEAIVSGDVADPGSKIARLLQEAPTSRRRLDKGTQPRVWYVDALPEALVPGRPAEQATWMWSERATPPPPDAVPPPAGADVWTTLDVSHPPQWGWHVWLYLVTKNIAAGAALAAPFLGTLGVAAGAARDFAPEAVALVFTAITSVLLVHDLGRPERFWRLVLKPNTRSWLVRGAWVLMAFGAVSAAALGLRLGGKGGAADVARVLAVPLAVLASGYSAWLFAQCRGRDLWLEPGLFVRLVLRAALLGAGFAALLPSAAAAPRRAGLVFALLALANVVAVAVEVAAGRRTGAAHRAHRMLSRAVRHLPFVLVASALFAAAHALLRDGGTAFACALVATLVVVIVMLVYERAWIRAGQAVPLS
jgi:Fe-S-cluster-containing dehydrogenase component